MKNPDKINTAKKKNINFINLKSYYKHSQGVYNSHTAVALFGYFTLTSISRICNISNGSQVPDIIITILPSFLLILILITSIYEIKTVHHLPVSAEIPYGSSTSHPLLLITPAQWPLLPPLWLSFPFLQHHALRCCNSFFIATLSAFLLLQHGCCSFSPAADKVMRFRIFFVPMFPSFCLDSCPP